MNKDEKERWQKNIKIAHEIAKDKERKERLIKKAYEIGGKYVPTYWGCAQITFMGIVDTLRTEGIEILTKEDQEKIFPAFVGLSGGTGNMGDGTCGDACGAGFCISLVANRSQGVDQKVQESNINNRWISFDAVYKYTVKKFLKEYNGLSCRAVTWARFGKHWDSWNPAAKAEFGKEEEERGCILDPAGYPCTIPRGIAWAVESIIDLLVHPITIEQVIEEHNLR